MSNERFIRSYKLLGLIVGKKGLSGTENDLCIFDADTGTIKDSGIQLSEIQALLNPTPEGAISNPSGGIVIDIEARAAISAILQALRNKEIIDT